jgi:hypothetical protein
VWRDADRPDEPSFALTFRLVESFQQLRNPDRSDPFPNQLQPFRDEHIFRSSAVHVGTQEFTESSHSLVVATGIEQLVADIFSGELVQRGRRAIGRAGLSG